MGQINRRKLLLAAGCALAAAASGVCAQPTRAPQRIGWLVIGSIEGYKDVFDAFDAEMKKLGYVASIDYVVERRAGDGNLQRLPALARELIARKPAVIITGGSPAIAALKSETRSVPIVFGSAAAPVEQGFVDSYARPGGNITGVSLRVELIAKLVELAREAKPGVRRVALLTVESDPAARPIADSFRKAADALGIESGLVNVTRADEIKPAVTRAAEQKYEALIAPSLSLLELNARTIAATALAVRLTLIANLAQSPDAGAPVGYFSNILDNYRRAAVLVVKVLKGANPAELPVEQPDQYRLVLNLRAARTLGITLPQSLILRADRVIE